MEIPYESAHDWNRRHPPGTPVRVVLRDGNFLHAFTAGPAQQWGALAILRLHEYPGLWTCSVLQTRDAP